MGAAVQLRSDYSGDDLRRLSRASRDAAQTRRLLSLAAIYDGGSRTMAARISGVGLQIVRDWVLRFNADGPAGLLDRKASGKTPLLSEAQRAALAQAVEAGPKPYLDGVVRWRLLDLVQWLRENFGVSVSRQTLGRELRAMGYAKLSARPRHYAQDAEAIENFKKTSPPNWRRSRKRSARVSRSRSGSKMRPASGRRTS
jgi:transposase